jgi:hypothetical protein
VRGRTLDKTIPFYSDRPIKEVVEWAGRALMNSCEGLFFVELEMVPSRFAKQVDFVPLIQAIKQARDIMVSIMTQ